MFRYVYAMSMPRSTALERASFYAGSLMEHLIKIVVYHDIRAEYVNHWIGEISSWLSDAGSITVKPDGRKLKPSDYMDTIFGWIGDELNDYRSLLDKFQHDNKRGKFNYEDNRAYPAVETTDELCKELWDVCTNLVEQTLPMLCGSDSCSRGDYNAVVKKVLEQYI